jgi:hypothetical protein
MIKFVKNMKIFNGLTLTEKLVLLFVFILLSIGVISSWVNLEWFNKRYAIEDGVIEWLTVLPLLIVVFISLRYVVKLHSRRNWLFSVTLCFLALFCFFVAGEEVSWGQRIFNVESSEFFKKNNAQAETNLHNLIVAGVKVNKLVFSQVLNLLAVIYLIVFPYLYSRKQWFKNLINTLGVPIVRPYHIVAFLFTAVLIALCNGRNSELLEFAACFIFLLIVAFPENKEVFTQ